MTDIPLRPRLRTYRGGKPELQRKAAEFNARAHRVAEHVNSLMADDPAEVQQYLFGTLAVDLGIPADEIREAIGNGGHNGITLGVRGAAREALARYKR